MNTAGPMRDLLQPSLTPITLGPDRGRQEPEAEQRGRSGSRARQFNDLGCLQVA